MKEKFTVFTLSLFTFTFSFALTPQETELREKLPAVFTASAEHYRALDAAATPLMKDEKGGFRTPHGILRWKTGKNELDMRSVLWWTAGHYPGSLWYLYEATGDAFFRDRATVWTELLAPNAKVTDNHDVGFIMNCSYGNARRLMKTDRYDALLVETASSLSQRFNRKLGLIRSWGAKDGKKEFLVIPDNMMNLELLEVASSLKGGNARFAEIAVSHADKSMENHFRADGGCYHVLNYDQRPGFEGTVQEIRRGQGLSCRTAWSRGQAWGIYGYAMMYRMTGLRRYLDFAMKLADFAIGHPNMPSDGVPCWDFGAPGEERDTSAAACMASALLELSTYVDPALRGRYRAFAVKQLLALSSAEYFSEGDEAGHFLLKHGVGHKPAHSEIDTPLDYGDYYFLEALLRFRAIVDEEARFGDVVAKLPAKAALPDDEHEFRLNRDKRTDIDKDPVPDTADEFYLDFTRNGNRTRYQKLYFGRFGMLDRLAEAERREGKGKYLAKLETLLAAICSMRSWTMPAHDRALDNFNGTRQTVDLGSSELAAHLACALALVGDRLSPATVSRVRREVEFRVFEPLRRELAIAGVLDARQAGAKRLHWWMDDIYNWNAVCWDNVLAAAMYFLDDPLDRARFTAAAIRASGSYMKGFRADGYCDEGMGYWNYGYGHHLLTARMLRKLTGGKIDFLKDPKERLIAGYARGDSYDAGSAPSFADGGGSASAAYLRLVDEFFPELPKDYLPSTTFPDAQVWIFRDPEGLSVAFKGGDNGVAHNHNDLGSYEVLVRGAKAGGDPGGEVYTARTFSKDRYVSKVLNSYGHPVPIVGGELQRNGKNFKAAVVDSKIDDKGVSEVTLELKGAYDVKTLKSLRRTFRYDRPAKKFTVIDRVEFSSPTAFEDAYTFFRAEDNPKRKGFAWDIRPQIETEGGETESADELVENPGAVRPVRTAIRFKSPLTRAEVRFIYSN